MASGLAGVSLHHHEAVCASGLPFALAAMAQCSHKQQQTNLESAKVSQITKDEVAIALLPEDVLSTAAIAGRFYG